MIFLLAIFLSQNFIFGIHTDFMPIPIVICQFFIIITDRNSCYQEDGHHEKLTTFNLDKKASQRANRNAAKQKKLNYLMKKRELEDELKKELARKRTAKKHTRVLSRMTADQVHHDLKNFQLATLFNGYSWDEDMEWRLQNQLTVQAFQSDEYAGFPFKQFLISYQEEDLVTLLNMWTCIERLRVSSSQLSTDFRNRSKYKMLLKAVLSQIEKDPEDLIKSYISTLVTSACLKIELDCVYTKLPEPLIRFQRDTFEILFEKFKDFINCERKFFHDVVFKEKQEKTSILRFHESVKESESMSSITDMEVTVTNPKIQKRSSRSTFLIIDLNNISSNDVYFSKLNDFSDDNGDEVVALKTKPTPKYINPPKMTLAQQYENVKIEYPLPQNQSRKSSFQRGPITSNRLSYMRPIKFQGAITMRPAVRPACFKDLLKDPVHFVFFKRFMNCHGVVSMLIFWKAVENLRQSANMKQRQIKAQNIMTKYFKTETPPNELLHCNEPIIMEIPNLEIVTTSMLFTVQATVFRYMESEWYSLYQTTFKQPLDIKPQEEEEVKEKEEKRDDRMVVRGLHATIFNEYDAETNANKPKVVKVWRALVRWVSSSIQFIKAMDNYDEYCMFQKFLQNQAKRVKSGFVSDADGKVSSTTLLPDKSKKPGKQVVCGYLITLENLAHDLDFFIETDRYKSMYVKAQKHGDPRSDFQVLKKASLIVECFLEPKIINWRQGFENFVNLPADTRKAAIDTVKSGLLDMGTFTDAVSYIYPVLIHYWKLYREKHVKTTYATWQKLQKKK